MHSYYSFEGDLAPRDKNDSRIRELNNRAQEIKNNSKNLVSSSKTASGKNTHIKAKTNALHQIGKSKNIAYNRLLNRGNRATDSYIDDYDNEYYESVNQDEVKIYWNSAYQKVFKKQ